MVVDEDQHKEWDILEDYNQEQQGLVEGVCFIHEQVINDISDWTLLVELIVSLINAWFDNIDQLSFRHELLLHGLIEASLLDAI